MPEFVDLTGRRFGRLTVIGRAEDYISPTGKKTVRWMCKCDCGRSVTVLRNSLLSGHTLSCGCLQREAAESAAEDLTGTQFGEWTVLSRAPLAKKDQNGGLNGWLCRCICGTERVVRTRLLTSGASRSCGCVTAKKAKSRIDDDNVLGRYNGTVISKLKSDKPTSASKTGVRGVYWSERDQRYIAKIMIRRKDIYLGRFRTLEEAAKARAEAEEKYYAPVIEEFEEQDK